MAAKRARTEPWAPMAKLPEPLWVHIIEFACGELLPVGVNAWRCSGWNYESSPYNMEHIKQRHAIAQTLCALRGTCKALAECFAPTNQAMWQELVLRHHSFDTTRDTFEDEFMANATWYVTEDHIKCYFKDRKVAKEAIRLRGWPQIGVAFRPCQFGFLERIQRGEQPRSEWPANEDAYTLYKDLFFLITCVGPVNVSMEFGESSRRGAPVLLSHEDGADVGYCVGLSEDPCREDAATTRSRLLYAKNERFKDNGMLCDKIEEEDGDFSDDDDDDEEDEEEDEENDDDDHNDAVEDESVDNEDSEEIDTASEEVNNIKDKVGIDGGSERSDSNKASKPEKERLFRLRLIDRIDATIATHWVTNNKGYSGMTPFFQIGRRTGAATNQKPDRRRWLGVAVVISWS